MTIGGGVGHWVRVVIGALVHWRPDANRFWIRATGVAEGLGLRT